MLKVYVMLSLQWCVEEEAGSLISFMSPLESNPLLLETYKN